jgi:hypothetical protein
MQNLWWRNGSEESSPADRRGSFAHCCGGNFILFFGILGSWCHPFVNGRLFALVGDSRAWGMVPSVQEVQFVLTG